jgi:TfoX/Sxy family transcriptional regulator of competence genes
MFMGLHEEKMVFRFSSEDCAEFMARYGARPFEVMKGRAMKDWAVVPESMLSDAKTLQVWIEKALAHAQANGKKKSGKKVGATKKKTARSA